MIYEDERAPAAEQLGFVLHLGDFIYEVVQYPDELKTRYDRTIYEVARIADGHKVGNFHIPLTVEGYRAIYRGYLADPDLQDARARWPFVAIWDNHEFSWQGWQSIVKAGAFEQPGQTVKVAANQAWFEYLPARVAPPSGSLERFDPPAVKNVPIDKFDRDGLGVEPNNLTAINSLKAYRALRYGRHLDLIITDQRSYRSADVFGDPSLGTLKESWPANAYASVGGGDYGTAYLERAEIYDLVRDEKITGFAIVSGDRHSFWAGYAAADLPPGKFEPVGLSFIGASLVSPGPMEANEHRLPKDAPLRPLFLADKPAGAKPDWTYNLLVRHGVRSCLEYAKSFDLKRARSLSNPDLAPHLEFVDLGGHGYAKVRLAAEEMRTEFVCIPRPVVRSEEPDGGPIRYRVVHTAALWKSGERPRLKTALLEGDAGLSI